MTQASPIYVHMISPTFIQASPDASSDDSEEEEDNDDGAMDTAESNNGAAAKVRHSSTFIIAC